ncbi:DinB family protein [compost metagenome]
MTENHSLSMYKYNTWANTTLLNHLKHLPEGTCTTKIKSVFPSIFDTLLHIYVVDRGWYSVLTKEYRSDDYETIKFSVNRLIAETKDSSLDEFEQKQNLLVANLQSFIENNDMNFHDLFSGVAMTYGDIITHIVNHGTYHRGNITAMLHQLDQKGVPTDYGAYLYYAT